MNGPEPLVLCRETVQCHVCASAKLYQHRPPGISQQAYAQGGTANGAIAGNGNSIFVFSRNERPVSLHKFSFEAHFGEGIVRNIGAAKKGGLFVDSQGCIVSHDNAANQVMPLRYHNCSSAGSSA